MDHWSKLAKCASESTTILKMSPDDSMPTPQLPPPDPKINDDGSYKCDRCHQKVRVGSGGAKNFMQHQSLPTCLKAASKHQSQMNLAGIKMKTLTSFFPKVSCSPKTVPTSSSTPSTSVLTNRRSSEPAGPSPDIPHPPLPSPTLSRPSSILRLQLARTECYRQPDTYMLTSDGKVRFGLVLCHFWLNC
jgi:hypothetical protein